jgi:hypothetical protein
VDSPSYALIYNNNTKSPSSFQNISLSNAVAGRRVWSTPRDIITTNAYLPPMYAYNNTISYVNFVYDHAWSLVSAINSTTISSNTYNDINGTQELQVFNGLYQSIGTTPSRDKGYLNYNTYLSNSIDYSTISTSDTVTNLYRFATFVWNYDGDITTTINSFVFKLINFKYNGSTPTIITSSSTGITTVSGALNRIFVHYRAEEYINIVPSSGNLSTIWVDANSKLGTNSSGLSSTIDNPSQITSSNYYVDNGQTEVKAPNSATWSMSGNDLIITVSSILFGASATKRYIYCRIGLPMNANYSFEYVTLQVI